MFRPRRAFGRALGLALVAPALIAGCALAPSGPAPVAPVAVRTAPVATANVAGAAVFSGTATSRDKVSLLPKVPGQITVLNIDVGSKVKKGDTIAELDHAALDAQVAQAEAGVAVAKSKLETVQAGSRPETIEQAQANLDAAKAALAFLQNGGRPETVQAAQGNLASAQAHLSALQGGRPEAVAQAQANLTAAKAKLQSLQNGSRQQSIDQAKANLDAAQARLQALKNGPTPQQVAVAQQTVEQAKDAAYAADVQKDGACNPMNPKYMCDAAQAAADGAHTAVNTAQAQLTLLTSAPTAEQLQQAQAAVDIAEKQYELAKQPYTAQDLAQAQSAVDAAQAGLQTAEHPGSAADVAAAQGAIEAAQAQVDLAKQPASSADLAKAAAAVDVAEQQLKLAEQPFTPQDLNAAQAAVQQAEAALQVAQVTRDQAIIIAPIDGVVSEKLLSLGAMAAPTTPIAVILDPNVDVVLDVDQAQANGLHVGDPATITADALPGKSIPAKISTIAPASDPKTHAVEVKVTPNDQTLGLTDGTLAQVSLVTATHQGVVVVPSSAIVQRGGSPTVYVVQNGTATPRTVQTGLSDGKVTEITGGLKVGELIVVSGQDKLNAAQPITVEK